MRGAGRTLGTYCLIDAHGKCPIPARCTCRCHVPVQAAPSRPGKVAPYAVVDPAGRRVCPECRRPFVRKPGPGRYPKVCADCRARAKKVAA